MGLSVEVTKQVNGFRLEVDWHVGNELAVLFGPSGSGKTLTLQLIAGLMQPDSGCIRANGRLLFDGREGVNLPPQRRHLGYVFQDLALFPHMTVRQNIAYGAAGLRRNEKDQRIGAMVEIFHLEGLEHKRPAEISGGQKQRVAIARALIRQPAALLLDEPFSALDAPLRREMRSFLKKIHAEFAIPVILVTHDLMEAATLADVLIMYHEGNIVQLGTPAEVMDHPATPEVAALVQPRELIDPAMPSLTPQAVVPPRVLPLRRRG